jgi:tetratricopeptide (TPR) repeat protein
VAAVLIPVLFLCMAEGGLRLAGYGYSPHFFQKATIEGRACLVENPKFGYRFFPEKLARIPAPIVMSSVKPPGTVRIFIMGESAALGDPRPEFGAGRYLEALLRERFPEKKFEVINTATTAINSHTIREIAADCADKSGDLWLVYMGNNEMVGPFGAGTVFGAQAPPLWSVRLNLLLKRTRLGQLVSDLGRRLIRRESKTAEWRGMGMFLNNQVPPDDPRRARVYDSYSKNIEAITRLGTRSGAKVVLSTVAVNLRDCPPFAGFDPGRLPSDSTMAYTNAAASAIKAETSSRWTEAAEDWARAVKDAPKAADPHYRLGRALLGLAQENWLPAGQELALARDLDALPFRADSRINEMIRKTAAAFTDEGVSLCDAEHALNAAGLGGVAGEESFYEHVHLNFDGNYRLAMIWAEAIEKALPMITSGRKPAWADQATCEAVLALSDWNRLSVVREVEDRLKQPPLSDQFDNSGRLRRVQRWISELEQRTRTNSVDQTRAMFAAALRDSPDDYRLHENYAEFLDDVGDRPGELAERRRICELTPHYYFAHFILGRTLKEQKQYDQAREALLKAAALNPNQPDIYQELGSVSALQGKWDVALREFDHALALSPNDPRLHLLEGDVLRRLERGNEAIAAIRRAVELRPDYLEARYRLGELLGRSGRTSEAASELAEVVRIKPDHVLARMNLGVALARLGKPGEAIAQFDAVLQLDPGNQAAQRFKQDVQAELGGAGGRK